MVQTVQNQLPNRHQFAAQELLPISETLQKIYLDQLDYLVSVTVDNFFQFDVQNHSFSVANDFLKIHIDKEVGVIFESQVQHLHTTIVKPLNIDRLIKYVIEDVYFYLHKYHEIHPTDLKTKAQIIRQTLIEQVFEWVDGENRVEQYLYNIQEDEADKIDQLLIKYEYFDHPYVSDFAKYGKAIPLSAEINIKHLVLINSVLGQEFLPVNELVQKFYQFLFCFEQCIPQHLFRIFQLLYPNSVQLQDVIRDFESIKLLSTHAQEQPHLIAYAGRMKRGFWQYQDLLNKQHFLNNQDEYWELDDAIRLPIFTLKRSVNWLFKQDALLNDWVAKHLEDVNVRITVTALSFIDTSKINSVVLLAVLKYFKNVAARLFLIKCYEYAITNEWQNDVKNTRYSFLNNNLSPNSNRKMISHSFLYIEEWLDFSALMLGDQPQQYKKLFIKINRVLQAYMHFLQNIVTVLPADLVQYMDLHLQQYPQFFIDLQKHNIKVEDFRKTFKHISHDQRSNHSIFDSYVSDYVVHLFNQHDEIHRNVTWASLYQQARHWHAHNHFVDTLSKLKEKIPAESWDRVAPMQKIYFEDWCYEELNSLKRIIQESVVFKHCLAMSYSQRIAEREYVAFHMTHIDDPTQEMTLGCFYKLGRLEFDQLRLPNNQIPEQQFHVKAMAFIQDVNQHLKWKSSIQPNEELGNL
ncbi:hypothetical protein EXE10_04250 [Acinetobacter sp. WCHAc060033]|uniref:hypothetical protein n=1 Tax=Acinetobacter sp. WCHAc060033 TaxID=2518624 RepID=UPI001022B1B4|nr:hypothetical protein [Acinetobacter sp. WCHAc060033]RZG87538.1 hypothetical protein EXE10_04250 [Acinetobacter sp. WCHAc060033]